MSEIVYQTLKAEKLNETLDDLASILHGCVQNGASVSFIHPFSKEDARSFWLKDVFPKVEKGETVLLVARADDRLVGTVQLQTNLPPNQTHRCEVAKLLVHPDYRKRGIATTLMENLEEEARALGKSLITLDTRSGDQAEPLYILLDYKIAGRIPNFARAADCDRLDSTTYMYKILEQTDL
ncbi:Ribosomal protein S18 acetylase RimI [Cohaesibacter marisflavi]|uniref:Ribosomal protein S18 acetylase RimI n=1 Tax=Cohaesibacter marisflavi TaxID=655353 RepID=A0A1I5B0Y8_9HYPH|nr:GNAT family N-acetyltransferase [Cohaesibacter marisflavi]SFN68139.1 Ribosomal protein S18 acetylase RimI [Cohaesibacter marisflavi]